MRSLIKPLIVLIALDCVITCVAVGGLGATEMNPVMNMVGGLAPFMSYKVMMAISTYYLLTYLEKLFPRTVTAGLIPLCALYGIVFISNVVNLAGFLL